MKTVVPLEQLSSDTRQLLEVLNGESDLVCVVVGAAFLDTALATLLAAKLLKSRVTEKLLAPSGVLGTFQARADLAYCLELISEERYQDLCFIAAIRNEFAHSHLQLTFRESGVQKLCARLQEYRILLHGEDEDVSSMPTEKELTIRARNQFNLSVTFLSNWLLISALGLKRGASV